MDTVNHYRYFIHLAYKGSRFAGWQIQPNAITVQELIENALNALLKHTSGVVGCGRTDAGVNASDFFCHFDTSTQLSISDCEQLTYKLNRFLPQDIVVFSVQIVLPDAHARFSALWREYKYVMITRKDPFMFQDAFLIHWKLNIDSINECANLLIGKHDFECFSKVNTQVNNFFCTIHEAKFQKIDHTLVFTIRADRFLRNMVRAIVGTLLEVGYGKLSKQDFLAIIDSHDRCKAGYSVPAQGLTLTKINYPESLFFNK